MHYIKLVAHVESHANTVSLLESGEQRYIKAIIIVIGGHHYDGWWTAVIIDRNC